MILFEMIKIDFFMEILGEAAGNRRRPRGRASGAAGEVEAKLE